MTKAMNKLGIEGACLKLMNKLHNKSTAKIVLNEAKLKQFPLKSGRRQECLLSPLLVNRLLEFLVIAIKQDKETKWIQIGKEVKLSLFADSIYKRS
jgi:hypothetical protein